MAGKITQLPLDASPGLDSLIETVDDPAGTPTNKRATLDSVATLIQGEVEDSILPIDLATDVTGALPAANIGAHATRHQSGGADPIKLDDLATPDDNTDLDASTAKHGLLKKLDNSAAHFLNGQGSWATPTGVTPAAHASSHQSGGSDPIKLDDLDTPDDNTDLNASSSRHGLLKKLDSDTTHFLRGDGAWSAPTGITPAAHASSHQAGGGDAIKLDDLATPDDNTDLNATSSAHGLLKKLDSDTTHFLRGDGTWAAVTGTTPASHASTHQAGGGDAIKLDDLASPDDNTDLNASTGAHGLLKKLDNDSTHFMRGDGTWAVPPGTGGATNVRAIGITIDGGGAAITTGIKGDLSIPFACTITGVRLLADQTGSIVVDIWKDTYANYPPTGADSITASAKPTITASNKANDTTLTGWTTSISAGDTLRFNVDSVSTIQRCTLVLTVTT